MAVDLTSIVARDEDFSVEQEEKTRFTYSVFDEYEVRPEGGLNYLPHHLIEEQRSGIWGFVKQAGKHLLTGGSLTQISLPVILSEPQSFLQRIATEFSCAPIFLHQASETADPLERMKLVVAFIIGGLNRQCIGQKKPFNPILGETYQASFFDGTRVFMEQTSHHPPVSHWDVEAPGRWRMYGHGEATATVTSGNTIRCGRKGRNSIHFASDGAIVSWDSPSLSVGGLMWGTRTMEFCGEMTIVDQKNNLSLSMKFDADSKKGSFFFGGGVTGVTDVIRGSLVKTDGKGNTVQTLSELEGSWIDNVSFDGKQVWDIRVHAGYSLIPHSEPLPSDSSFRSDLLALASGNIVLAQSEKERLEVLQRGEKKLRKEGYARLGIKH